MIVLPDTASELHLDIIKLRRSEANLLSVKKDLRKYIENNVRKIGKYIHGNKFTAFIWSGIGRGMEYDGAMTTEASSLEHEVFHSWFGRGVKPASQNDGWIDEGWNEYTTNDTSWKPFTISEAGTILSSSNPFNRITPANSYTDGPRFFSTLAETLGSTNLVSYMNSFYEKNKGGLITTKQLESYLLEQSGITKISDYFRHFVYGIST